MIDTTIIPLYIMIITGVFALANIGYGIVGYFKPSQIFEKSTEGVDVKGKEASYAWYEYASRNLSIGIGLLIVAIMGSPLSIVMVMGIRALVEVQSMLINLSLKKINEGFITAAVFFAIELFVIVKMFI
jgi:hypothetical protein